MIVRLNTWSRGADSSLCHVDNFPYLSQVLIIDLHRKQKPFAVTVSNETFGRLYSILFKDRYLRCQELNRYEIRWFCDNINLFKVTHETKDGKVYEYRMFKRSMSNSMKHNFLVRNKIINDSYI
jgi:hypothetical protein